MERNHEEVAAADIKAPAKRFSEFYEKWMAQLDDILRQLLKSVNHQNGSTLNDGQDKESLVTKVTTHQKEYYAAKWAAAHEDVLAFYAPSWLSPLEVAYSWVTGWKPSMVFRVIDSLKKRAEGGEGEWQWEYSEERVRKMGELRVRIRIEEEKVEREMERQQVAMCDRKMVELSRLASSRHEHHQTDNNDDEEDKRIEEMVEVALKGLKGELEKVMKAADCVRLKTLKGVLDILTPRSKQCVEFLAAAFLLQLQIRKWGCAKDQDQNQIQRPTLF